MVDEVDKIISEAHGKANGWNIDHFNSGTPFNKHFFYVVDPHLGMIQMFSVHKETVPASTPLATGDCVSAVAHLMKKASKKPLKPNMVNGLAGASLHYLIQTQTYRMWKQQTAPDDRFHALLLIYRQGAVESLMRPAMLNPKGAIASTEELKGLVEHIMGTDRVNHPDWFNFMKMKLK
ncbi:MAG: hypothetical protein CL840_01285 [Crocinitomicaceae bacterium]|nr:hypothetical protein [Crocinitomicaceae bacterium]